MAKTPEVPKKSKTPKSKAPKSKAHRPDVQPIAPALAELLNPAINRGDAGMGSGTGLQPPPDNSWDRRAGGEAAAHRARASTKGTSEDVGKRDASNQGLEEAPQANYGTSATIPTLDPELARQLGLPTAEDDDEALARPPRSKMEALRRQGHRRRAGESDPRRPPGIQGRRRPGEESGRRTGRRARKNPKAACASRSSPNTNRRATSRPRSRNWSKASTATTAPRCCSASPGPARPTPWPR